MKTLVLMRHGEAGDADTDHARPLSPRGRQQCQRVGRELLDAGFMPGRVVCSSAERAHASARLIVEALAWQGALEVDASLYLAEAGAYIDALRATADEVASVLLVAHNPGLSELASNLEGAHVALPTAGYALTQHDLTHWSRLGL